MKNPVSSVDVSTTSDPEERAPGEQEVREALERVLTSNSFRSSRQSQRLLLHLVEHALAGKEDQLKERLIGIEVFGKSSDYDTGEDPIVRVRAADLRKRLAQYYVSAGRGDLLQIAVLPGSYRPAFLWSGDSPGASLPSVDATETAALLLSTEASHRPETAESHGDAVGELPEPARPRFMRPDLSGRRGFLIVLTCLLLITVVSYTIRLLRPPSLAPVFWAPLLEGHRPVLIYLGTDAVYRLSDSFIDHYRQEQDLPAGSREIFVPLRPGTKLDEQDLIGMPGTFLQGNDVAATGSIITVLTRHNKNYDLRWGQDIAPGDLRNSPVILIGGFNNTWTVETTHRLRFVFRGSTEILDTAAPGHHWNVRLDEKNQVTDDFAIISRIQNLASGMALITVAGIGQTGTEAAGAFLADDRRLNLALRQLPSDWPGKNLQILLHVKTADGVPTDVTVVEAIAW